MEQCVYITVLLPPSLAALADLGGRDHRQQCRWAGHTYLMERGDMVCVIPKCVMPTSEQYTALAMFDAYVSSHKSRWFIDPPKMLKNPDWRVATGYIHQAARVIQVQWRKSIICPHYQLCKQRLLQEFCELQKHMPKILANKPNPKPSRNADDRHAPLEQ